MSGTFRREVSFFTMLSCEELCEALFSVLIANSETVSSDLLTEYLCNSEDDSYRDMNSTRRIDAF
jgi:hypothetical protein